MIVERRVHPIKLGQLQIATDLILAEDWGIAFQLYHPMSGHMEVIMVDCTWESVDAAERYWAAWGSNPNSPAWFAKWLEVAEAGWTREFFQLVQQ